DSQTRPIWRLFRAFCKGRRPRQRMPVCVSGRVRHEDLQQFVEVALSVRRRTYLPVVDPEPALSFRLTDQWSDLRPCQPGMRLPGVDAESCPQSQGVHHEFEGHIVAAE